MVTVTRTPDEVVEALSAGCLPCELAAQVEDADLEEPETPARWEGVLTYEGQMTGDGRIIENDALRWDTLPVPLRWVSEDVGAHAGATVVGRITEIERREDGAIWAAGDFDLGSEKGREAARQVQEGLTPGVSVDLDDVSFEVRVAADNEVENLFEDDVDEDGRVKRMAMNADDEITITTSGRIRAATLVAIPAFEPARLALVASIALTASGLEALKAAFNEDQLRVPRGNGELSGRWLDMPTSLLKDLFNSLDYDEDGEDSPVQEALRNAYVHSTEADAHRYSNSEKHNEELDKANQELDRAAAEVAASDPKTMERIDEARDAIRAFQDVDWGDGVDEDLDPDGMGDADPERDVTNDDEDDSFLDDIANGEDDVQKKADAVDRIRSGETGGERNEDLVRKSEEISSALFEMSEKIDEEWGDERTDVTDVLRGKLTDAAEEGASHETMLSDVVIGLHNLLRDEDDPNLKEMLAQLEERVRDVVDSGDDDRFSSDSEKFDSDPDTNWIEETGTGHLPNYIRRIADHLIAQGMTQSRAIASAVNTVKRWARGGSVRENGGPNVKPDTVAKAAAALAEWESKKAQAQASAAESEIFRDVDTKERKGLAKEGHALPDGSFPIANVQDLKNAIQAIGRAKDPDAAKAHIKRRARNLGEESLIPDNWSVLTAGAFPLQPPTEWFSDPNLSGPTPIKIGKDGRVYGHLAVWGTCHTGYPNQCVTAPSSPTGYAYFRTGSIITKDGSEIPIGRITMDTLHAGQKLNAAQTMAHYEDTGRAAADVAVGEDAFGIWIAGALRSDISDEKVRALRASPLSGDWRRVAGNLELIAALAVNVPGFPIPRPKGLVAGGAMQSLVASGMVAPDIEEQEKSETLTAEDMAYLKRLADREREQVAAEAATLALEVDVVDFAHKIGI